MKEVFESEAFSLRYEEEVNACVLVLKTYSGKDDFRTPMMHALEIIKKHDCEDFIIDGRLCLNESEADRKWMRKVMLPKLCTTKCRNLYFVVDEDKSGTECDCEPFSLFAKKFKTCKVSSEEFAFKMIKKHAADVGASDCVCCMTKKEALEYMGLPEDASDFQIDDKFWKLSKQLRNENTDESKQKINDLSAAYDIATGKRDERVLKAQQRQQAKKFLGKTGDEWRTYFSYTWYKYLIGIAILYVIGNLLYTIFLRPGYDSGVLSIGHFSNDSDYIEQLLTTRLGFENPFVSLVDIVVPNDEGASQDAYADQQAATLMMSCPNLLIFDEATMPYYYTSLMDISSVYELCRESLTDAEFAKLTPVYLSERSYMEIANEYEETMGAELTEAEEDLSSYDDTPVMVGIMIEDEDAISELGYYNLWSQKDDTLVFSIYTQTMNFQDSEEILLKIFKEVL